MNYTIAQTAEFHQYNITVYYKITVILVILVTQKILLSLTISF